ncbi:hypothetical protein [Psychromonas antarctica]|uniref:hypothetical protein n=1 Tax=Psychromonas antarctica TaxID=67573 RepID=UPI001EE99B32|nr:hypothetical protein [Psychromonas antarctica]MCG6202130.1 hypothetical protein [Psychromonas antarctica]
MRYLLLLTVIILSGCSVATPPYVASISNVQVIKRSDIKALNVGDFKTDKNLNSIGLRASNLSSSVGKSFGDYLTKAITDELKLANVWSGVSDTVVSGELLENDIDISGFSIGTGIISVRFLVKKGDLLIFDKKITATHQFESSFMGNIAIPNGQMSYVDLVQNLVKALFSDPEFIQAVS